jgi:hypothetical protein
MHGLQELLKLQALQGGRKLQRLQFALLRQIPQSPLPRPTRSSSVHRPGFVRVSGNPRSICFVARSALPSQYAYKDFDIEFVHWEGRGMDNVQSLSLIKPQPAGPCLNSRYLTSSNQVVWALIVRRDNIRRSRLDIRPRFSSGFSFRQVLAILICREIPHYLSLQPANLLSCGLTTNTGAPLRTSLGSHVRFSQLRQRCKR